MKIDKTYLLWALALPAIIVVFDQLSKAWILKKFAVPHNICAINPYPGLEIEISPIFDFALVCNRGVSFGLMQADTMLGRVLLTSFALIMVVVLLYWLTKEKHTLTKLSLSLIIGGAIGNAIDRGLYGAVTDFLNFSDIGFKYVFNIADSAISVGVAGLILSLFLQEKADRRIKTDSGQ